MIDLKEDSNNLKNIKKKYKIKEDFEKTMKEIELDMNNDDNFEEEIIKLKKSFTELKNISKKMEYYLDDKKQINEKDNKFMIDHIDKKKKIIILLIILYILCCIIYKNRKQLFNRFDKQIGGTEVVVSLQDQILDNLPFTGKLMPMFFVCILILLAILYLKKRKLKIICNCDNGSWWYSCVEGSGYGSPTCNVYHKFMDALEFLGERVIYLFNKIVWFRNMIQNAIIKSFKTITNAMRVVINKVPGLPNLDKIVDTIFPRLNINCSIPMPFGIPDPDPCSALNSMWRGVAEGLKQSFKGINKILVMVFKMMMIAITKSFELIKILIKNTIKYALHPIFLIMRSVKYLMKKFMNLIQSILDIGIFKILVFQVANTIAQITGIADIGSVLGSAFITVFTIICMPIIGGLGVVISFVFSILSTILGFIFSALSSIITTLLTL